MPADASFPLTSIRTDGWFERIGESVGSFQALCDIVGERFFAFSMITGARITALTVDRRTPDNTLVDFVVGAAEEEVTRADTQRLTLAEFRRRLVSALVADEPAGPPPKRATDTEAIQLHVGVRYLLLAPLYGYSLLELLTTPQGSELRLLHDGVEATYALPAFRERIKTHVRQELARVSKSGGRGAIDLSHVKAAEDAAAANNHRTRRRAARTVAGAAHDLPAGHPRASSSTRRRAPSSRGGSASSAPRASRSGTHPREKRCFV